MTYGLGHEISDAKVFAEEGTDLCAAHVVPDLLRMEFVSFDNERFRRFRSARSYLVNDVNVVSPLWLQLQHCVFQVRPSSLNDECPI